MAAASARPIPPRAAPSPRPRRVPPAVRTGALREEAAHAPEALLVLCLGEGVLHGVDRVVVGEVQLGEVVALLGLVEDVLLDRGAVEDDIALLGGELAEGHVGAHPHGAADLLHEIPHEASPGQNRAVVDGDGLVRNERGLVDHAHDAGPAAGGAGAGAVEGEVLRPGPEEGAAAPRADDRLVGRHRHRGGRSCPGAAAIGSPRARRAGAGCSAARTSCRRCCARRERRGAGAGRAPRGRSERRRPRRGSPASCDDACTWRATRGSGGCPPRRARRGRASSSPSPRRRRPPRACSADVDVDAPSGCGRARRAPRRGPAPPRRRARPR